MFYVTRRKLRNLGRHYTLSYIEKSRYMSRNLKLTDVSKISEKKKYSAIPHPTNTSKKILSCSSHRLFVVNSSYNKDQAITIFFMQNSCPILRCPLSGVAVCLWYGLWIKNTSTMADKNGEIIKINYPPCFCSVICVFTLF